MEQDRLFRLAVDAISAQARFVPGEGWRLTVVIRRGDETWDEAPTVVYTWLQTAELVDVLEGELISALGL